MLLFCFDHLNFGNSKLFRISTFDIRINYYNSVISFDNNFLLQIVQTPILKDQYFRAPMKIPPFRNCLFGILTAILVVFSGWYAYSEQGGVIQIYKNALAPFDDEKKVDSVLPLTEKTVLVQAKYQGGNFWTETRKDKIARFQCSQCHNNKNVTIKRAAEMAHGVIALDHGSQVTA